MKKRILSLLLILCLLAAFLPQGVLTASAASYSGSCGANGDNLTWTFDDSTGLLTISGSGDMADWASNTMPWNSYRSSITTVVIGSAVTSIGNYTFYGCTGLTSVVIPDSVTSIGYSTFEGCTGLGSVTIPHSVTFIGSSAFRNCTGLSSVVIPHSVTFIGSSAFRNCTELSSVTIPDSAISIGNAAFYNTGYYNDSTNWVDNVLYIGNHLIKAKDDISGGYAIREGTLTIADYAFSYCTGLSSVTIPHSVVFIGDSAFYECTGLSSVTIPHGVTSIGYSTFSGCTGLCSVTIPDSVTSIGGSAFAYCTNLTSVTIPDSVISIGTSAFRSCIGLSSVNIPDGVTSIGDTAFHGCTGLASVTIPDGVTSIGNAAFYNTDYYNDGTNWVDNVLYIGNHLIKTKLAIPQSYAVREGTLTIADSAFFSRTELSSVTIPDSVTSIGNSAFDGCTGLSSVVFPDSVISIGNLALAFCTGLTSVVIPDGVTSIGYGAFEGCTGLTSVSIPNSVTSIGAYAFEGTGLSSVILGNGISTIDWGIFDDYTYLAKICIVNPSCKISKLLIAEDGVICGQPSSTAEAYAEENGHTFYRLCQCKDYACDYEVQLVQTSCTEAYARFTCRQCGYFYESSTTPTGHSYSFYRNNGADHSVKCALCTSMYTEAHSFKDGICICGAVAPTLDADIAIYHSLDLASSISMNYAVPTSLMEKYDSCYLEVLIPKYEGNELVRSTTVRIDPVSKGNYEYFTLNDLTAIQMGDTVEATLHMEKDGKSFVSKVDSYSIATYALSQLNKANAPDSLKKLCADLLHYGGQTQLFKGYRTDAPADALMTEAHRAYLTDAQAVPLGNTNEKLNDLANPCVTWVGTSLNLESRIALKYVFSVANYTGALSDLSLHISYTDIHGQKQRAVITDLEEYNTAQHMYAFSFNGLLAAELRCVVDVAVFAGDTQLSQTLRYSPDTYGSNKPEQLKYLCKTLMAYSDSAKDFFLN